MCLYQYSRQEQPVRANDRYESGIEVDGERGSRHYVVVLLRYVVALLRSTRDGFDGVIYFAPKLILIVSRPPFSPPPLPFLHNVYNMQPPPALIRECRLRVQPACWGTFWGSVRTCQVVGCCTVWLEFADVADAIRCKNIVHSDGGDSHLPRPA